MNERSVGCGEYYDTTYVLTKLQNNAYPSSIGCRLYYRTENRILEDVSQEAGESLFVNCTILNQPDIPPYT